MISGTVSANDANVAVRLHERRRLPTKNAMKFKGHHNHLRNNNNNSNKKKKKNAKNIIECATAKVCLKEWQKVEQGLKKGEQVLLFRKGGINDPKGSFELKSLVFALFPTYFHQRKNDENENDDDDEKNMKSESETLTIVCRVTRAWSTTDKTAIKELMKFHCLEEGEIVKRVNYKPNEAFSILEVRAYALPNGEGERRELLNPGGCNSWIEKMPFSLPDTTTLMPILDQRDWLISQSDLNRKIAVMTALGSDIKELSI
jgi:hypothetical protein